VTPEEGRAAGRLVVRAVAGGVRHVQEWHEGIAARPLRILGAPAAPVRVLHDAVVTASYRSVYRVTRSLGWVAGELAASAVPTGAWGGATVAAVNGAVGDLLEGEASPLAIRMSVRVDGRDVSTGQLADAFPSATGKLAVLLPGLGESELAWQLHACREPGAPAVSYGTRLAADFGYTSVYLRYNTGRHISANGRELAGLLTEVVRAWPVPVEDIVLIGHSMGGLVARSAGVYGAESAEPWVPLVQDVFCLGSPHHGAPLEQGAGYLTWILAHVPETRALARLVAGRSRGVKDLRFGYLVDDDWRDCDADGCLRNHRREVPMRARHHLIAATVARDPASLAGRLVGDWLVLPGSGTARRRPARGAVAASEPGTDAVGPTVLGGVHHLQLLNHPDVYAAITARLAARGRDDALAEDARPG